MPRADTHAMSAHLAEISLAIDPGAHGVVILDRAGWHTSSKLEVPHNITLMPLPPRSPELNTVEHIWQFMRDNWLSNRVFQSYEDILDHCCHAWNNLVSPAFALGQSVSMIGQLLGHRGSPRARARP